MRAVDMMLRVVLLIVLWVVLAVVIPMFGFVLMMLVVMLWVFLMMLRVGRTINGDKCDQLDQQTEGTLFAYTIKDMTLGVVHMMLRIMLWMLRDQMMKKMARVRDDLTKLQERLEMAYRKLEYADEEMMIVRYDTTNTLFHNLRGVLNDLQDLQDLNDELFKHEDTMETTFSKEHWYSPFIYVYHDLIYFPWQISSQIRTLKTIESTFEEILHQKLNDGLTLFNLNTTVEHDTNLVGGIEQDIKNLVDKLMITRSSPGVHVYGIVGERGIGKTTLARKIFNHQTIKDKFQSSPPIWVDVHMNSTFHTIMNSINKFGGDLIQEKEILVVLNDVNDSKVLKDMIDYMHLITNANVLVTTRYESVIPHEGIYKHKLPLLSEDDGWALMCKLLFNDGEKGNMQHFEQIGKKMVNKCHGLPLSIKTIARIVNTKEKSRSKWEKVLENIIVSLEPSNKTLPKPVYLLPYENLSPYIKQCLIFYAFFPEDYIFDKNILIQQWVAAGLVKKPSMSTKEEKGEMQLSEEVANDYYMELLESNILQPAAECIYYDDKAMCRMHGSMHMFDQHLVQNYGYFQGDIKALEEATTSPSSSSIQKLNHLVITNHAPLNEFPKIVKKQTSVRTLVITCKLEITKLPEDLFQKLKLLRILDISGSDCRVLPKSLFKLVHLRHLNLSCLPIKTLPDAIRNLINLQHLILRYCGSLLDLPETSITRLQNLRSIDLHQTPLRGRPIGIGKIYHLTSLIGFMPMENIIYNNTLEDIHYLKELRTLNIVNLEVANVPYSEILQEHTNLIDLTLSCQGEGQPYTEGEKQKMQKCFEVLDPSSTLIQHIKINGYFGLEFPRWIMDLPFGNLKSLDLLKCKYCTELPPLYHFPLLEHLRVEDAWSIKHIDLDIGPWSNAPSLRSLILKDMPEWEEWTWEPHQSHSAMPILQLLEIINCPKLKSLPQGLPYHAKNLDSLTIYKAHSLEKVEGFASLKTATFFSNHNLSIIYDLPATCNFEIDDCPKLDVTLLPQTSPTDAC